MAASLFYCLFSVFVVLHVDLASGSKPALVRRVSSHYTINPEATPSITPCSFYGNPVPTIVWSRAGHSLSSSPEDEPYYTSDGTLVLTHASPADSGNYTCTGINSQGNSSASTEITIQLSAGKSSTGKQLGMVFLYTFIAWIVLSTLIAIYMLCRSSCCSSTSLELTTNQPSGATVYGNTEIDQTPSEWTPQADRENLKLIDLARDGEEWKTIDRRFKSTLGAANILSIIRIQNKWLWKKYTLEKELLNRKNKGRINEKELFHGTRANDPKLIYNGQQGFDMRMSNNGLWGQANYFAVNSSYSDQYAFVSGGTREMFLVKVLTGDSYECNPNSNLRLPPKKPVTQACPSTTAVTNPGTAVAGEENVWTTAGSLRFEVQRYDTVTGTTGGSRVYMTYDNEKSYPAYLIRYKK